ncbi:MAG: hypothetical protein WCI74_03190 [Actinomycetes bacterium]
MPTSPAPTASGSTTAQATGNGKPAPVCPDKSKDGKTHIKVGQTCGVRWKRPEWTHYDLSNPNVLSAGRDDAGWWAFTGKAPGECVAKGYRNDILIHTFNFVVEPN